MNNLRVVVKLSDGLYDFSSLVVDEITLSGRKNSAARKLETTFINDDQNIKRPTIDVEKGASIYIYEDEKELFRGIIAHVKDGKSKEQKIIAYDCGIYLSNNKDTFVYENCTASAMFRDVCKRFDIKCGNVAETGYVIPDLIKKATTIFDLLCDALSQTYKATGKRYYIGVSEGKISLLRRSERIVETKLKYGTNIINYDFSKSIEKTRTRLKVYSSDNEVVAYRANSALEKSIGIFQDVKSLTDKYTEAKLNEIIDTFADETSQIAVSISVEAVGNNECITGNAVFVKIPQLKLDRAFYIEADTHRYSKKGHLMTLTLNYATDINKAFS